MRADAGKWVIIAGTMHLNRYVERGDVWILKATAVKIDPGILVIPKSTHRLDHRIAEG